MEEGYSIGRGELGGNTFFTILRKGQTYFGNENTFLKSYLAAAIEEICPVRSTVKWMYVLGEAGAACLKVHLSRLNRGGLGP